MNEDALQRAAVLARPDGIRAVGRSLAEGLRFIRSSELVLLSMIVIGLSSMLGMNLRVVVPALADEVLHLDATGFGFLMTATGVGSLLAAASIAVMPREHVGLIAGGAMLMGAAQVVAAFATTMPLALAAMLAVGFGAIGMLATGNTAIQLRSPDALRGRVMSVYTVLFVGATPVGGLIAGGIASAWGVPMALALGGSACVVVGAAAYVWLHRIRVRERLVPPTAIAGTSPADIGPA